MSDSSSLEEEQESLGFEDNEGSSGDSSPTTRKSVTKKRQRYSTCPYCLGIFFNRADLKAHKKFHRQRSLYPCKFCIRSFASTNSLNFHEQKCISVFSLRLQDHIVTVQMANALFSCLRDPPPRSSALVTSVKTAKKLPSFKSPQPGSSSKGNSGKSVNKNATISMLKGHSAPSSYSVKTGINSAGERKKIFVCSHLNCDKKFSCESVLFEHLEFHAKGSEKKLETGEHVSSIPIQESGRKLRSHR